MARWVTCRSSPVPHRFDNRRCEDETQDVVVAACSWEDDAEEVRKALGDLVYAKRDVRSKEAFVRFERLMELVRAMPPSGAASIHNATVAMWNWERTAKGWRERCVTAEEERDAMALALARKEIAK